MQFDAHIWKVYFVYYNTQRIAAVHFDTFNWPFHCHKKKVLGQLRVRNFLKIKF